MAAERRHGVGRTSSRTKRKVYFASLRGFITADLSFARDETLYEDGEMDRGKQ
jgi:hypothetical protein